jgi:hypothetical protein
MHDHHHDYHNHDNGLSGDHHDDLHDHDRSRHGDLLLRLDARLSRSVDSAD